MIIDVIFDFQWCEKSSGAEKTKVHQLKPIYLIAAIHKEKSRKVFLIWQERVSIEVKATCARNRK